MKEVVVRVEVSEGRINDTGRDSEEAVVDNSI